MTYFSLRKRDPEPEPEELEGEQPEEASDEPDEEAPAAPRNPVAAGLTGPGRWIAARFGMGAAWGVHAVAVWAIGFYGGWVAVTVLVVWVGAVLAFVPRETLERATARVEGWGDARSAALDEAAASTGAEAEEGAPVDPYRVLVGWLDDLTRGRSGIHLDELHQALTRHPQLAGLKRPEMRAWLDRHHITVDRTLRVGTVAGRSGVSRATVEALIKRLPPLLESGGVDPLLHASDQCVSPVESGVERGGERAV